MCHHHAAHRGHTAAWGRHHWGHGPWAKHFANTSVPVNIRESDEAYEIQVFAPGLDKLAFNIKVVGDKLSIRCDKVETPPLKPGEQWLREEYQRSGFERQFQLSDNVDSTDIHARYEDGVLRVTVPKLPEAVRPGKAVPVA